MTGLVARYGRNRVLLAGGAAVVACFVAGLAIAAVAGGGGNSPAAAESSPAAGATASPTPPATPTPEASPTPIVYAGILDGLPMTEEEWAARKDLLPLAVMVDNTTGAYPQAGLDRADVVYETFVEGGITRLMAVYWRQEAEKILPVRSARTPFVIWVSEVGALYGHAGGAITDNDANALGQIVEWNIKDLNAFSDVSNRYYYRDAERFGPYDLGTSTSYLREAAGLLGFSGPPVVETWKFRQPGVPSAAGPDARGIEVDFSGRLNAWQYIQWKWDEASRRYLRFQFGGPHLDAVTNQQLAFATVVVMRAEARVVDEAGHVLLEQFGEGPATVFTGSRAYEGTWKKADRAARTRFYAVDGTEITFERGPIFIEVIGQQSRFAYFGDAADLPAIPKYEPPPPGTGPAQEDPEPEPTPVASPSATATAAPSSTAPSGTGTPIASQTPASGTPPGGTPSPEASQSPIVTAPPGSPTHVVTLEPE